MKIYLDVSCLNRPFDDQSQPRVRLETEAVLAILQRCASGEWEQISSGMATIEIEAIDDGERRDRVLLLLPETAAFVTLGEDVWKRAFAMQDMGFKAADAVHLAAAEAGHADVFATCDDRLLRTARRQKERLALRVVNPLQWLTELSNGHAG